MCGRKEQRIKVNTQTAVRADGLFVLHFLIFALHTYFYRREICGFLFIALRLVRNYILEVTYIKITSALKITDAHTHLPVDPKNFTEKRDALLRVMQKNGVSRGVIISDSELESSIGSLTDCAELFRGHADIAVVGGISPYIQYERQLKQLETYIAEGLVAGIKLFCGHEPIFLNDPVLTPVYSLAEKYSVPVLFHSGWDNPQYSAPDVIRQAAEEHPRVRFVCCHCCYPSLTACFHALLGLRNVFFDISSIADSDASVFKTILEEAIRQSPERFIFGSDYGSCSQKAHLDFAVSLNISEKNRKLLLYDNASRLYFNGR